MTYYKNHHRQPKDQEQRSERPRFSRSSESVELPKLDTNFQSFSWIQRGNKLTTADNPNLSVFVPNNVSLIGEKGNYSFRKDY